jgi:hypothetical protein
MQNNIAMQILWLACGAATIIAGVLASRSRGARYVGRAGVGVLFVFGGRSCTPSTSCRAVTMPTSRTRRTSGG